MGSGVDRKRQAVILFARREGWGWISEGGFVGFFEGGFGFVESGVGSSFGDDGGFVVGGGAVALALGVEAEAVVDDLELVLGFGGSAGGELGAALSIDERFFRVDQGFPFFLGIGGGDPLRAPVVLGAAVLLVEALVVGE